jgi:LacI family transcriptional regulator
LNRNITIKDVARHLGMGIGTVSRAINQQEGVSQRTKEKVFKVIDELGYTPNRVAQSMRTNKYNNIAFFIDISNIAFAQIAKGISDFLDDHGYFLTLYNLGNRDIRNKIETFIKDNRYDGIILSLPREDDEEIRTMLNLTKVPIVTLDRDIEGIPAGVTTDYLGSVVKATEYLLSLGHRGIALLTGTNKIRPTRESIKGFRTAFQNFGIPFEHSRILEGELTPSFGRQSMVQLIPLIREGSITAVFSLNEQVFRGVLQVLRDHDLSYPDEVSLITFEDSELPELLKPSVTAVSRPLYEMGTRVAQLLITYIQDTNLYGKLPPSVIQNQLFIRNSCKHLK